MPASEHAQPSNRRRGSLRGWTHAIAWLLCVVTFPLLWVGGLVTTTKSGMAVPDWPDTYGYNLFLYPLESWLLGPWDLFIEHGHRLLASLAGLVTIALMVLLWRRDERQWLRYVGVVALVGVIAQGVIGGLRVVLDERLLAMLHGTAGPLFFGLTAAIVVWTSRFWRDVGRQHNVLLLGRLLPIAMTTCLLVYVQMVVGAMLRHMPVSATPHAFAAVVKVHLVLAGIVLFASVAVAWHSFRPALPPAVRRAGIAVAIIAALQLLLGIATWLAKYGTPVWAQTILGTSATAIVAEGWWQAHVVTAHQATGSLLLISVLVTLLISWRVAPSRVFASHTATISEPTTSALA